MDDINASENTEISFGSCCRNSQGCFHLPSFTTIEEIVTSCEVWRWSTNRFIMTIVIHGIDNNNTYVGHLSREFSCLLWHFLTHGGEIECKVTGRRQRSPLIQGRMKILCYVTLHGKKLVVRVRDIIAGGN